MNDNIETPISNGVSDHSTELENNKCTNKGKDPIEAQQDPAFYTDAAAYWEKIPATVNGVLGGFESVSSTDIIGSESLLKGIFKMRNSPCHTRALDCGAGIGRITKFLLQKHFGKVDLVEQCSQFLDKAKETFKNSKKIGNYYCIGLQNFTPVPNYYDIIWCQWVLGHLNDKDLESFFTRLISGLRPNGVIVVKENISGEGKVELDEEDSSVTRPEELLLQILDRAGLHVFKNIRQRNLPEGIYEVRMLCCKPKVIAN
ncbi:UNVERIFIED_CONTAM: hypothetical protein GTU68_064414 [Idotea baltica]|nr:hypothetical protein [Idotea baltica]